jgi:hypothetical protein
MTYQNILIGAFLYLILNVPSVASNMKKTELIHEIKIENNQLMIKMLSNGCSVENSFQLIWTDEKHLTVYRISPDRCRRVPFEKWFTFTLPEKVKTFTISNAFRVDKK